MSDFLPFIVIGITTGAVYGLAGVGLVLTYKTSGIFNFAYGAVAALAVFVFYWLHTEHGMPWPYAAALCLFVLSPLEGLVLELVARTLENATATLKVVSTVGILIFMIGLGEIWYGNSNTSFPSFLDTNTVRFLGVNIGFDQITVLIISVAATAILYYFLRFVRLGVAMRGVVDNPELVSRTGTNPVVVRRWAWIIGTIFASMAGLLIAPSLNLDAYTIALLVVSAFGAAAIGYFSNLPLVFVGGLFVGVVDALATKYAASISWLGGLSAGLPFIILFIVLIVMPRARLAERRVVTSVPLRQSWYAPTRMRLVAAAIALAFFAYVPAFVGTQLVSWSSGLVYVMLFLSLGLLIKTSGQISLCHLAFAAVGASAFGHLAVDWHVPWLAALLLAGLVAMPVGAIIAIPAIRLSGVFLALATLGFGILFEQMFYQTGLMFGPTTSGIPAPRPDVTIFGWQLFSDKGFYYVLLVFVVLTVVAVQCILRGRMGRLLKGLSDSAVALETHGATTNVMKVLVFCITAGLAAIAGALLASLYDYGLGTNYSSFSSLTMVAIVVVIVMGDPWYAIVAGITFGVIPSYINVSNIYYYESMLFGLSAATFAVQVNRVPSVPQGVVRVIDRWGGRAPETVLAQGELEELVSDAAAEEKQSARADREMARRVAAGSPGQGRSRGARAIGPVRRGAGGRQRQPRRADGAHHWVGRAERGRQDDDLQRLLGSAQADGREGSPAQSRRDGDGSGGAVALRTRADVPDGRAFQLALRAPERRAGARGGHGRGQPHHPVGGETSRSRRGAASGRRGDGADRDRPALRRPGRAPPHRPAPPGRAGPCPGGALRPASLGRALRRARCHRDDPVRLRADRRGGRARHRHPAGRARHGPGATGLCPRLHARLRPPGLRGQPGRHVGQRRRPRGLSRLRERRGRGRQPRPGGRGQRRRRRAGMCTRAARPRGET